MDHKDLVLVVDDDRLNRLLISKSVANSGYPVETATNGQQALDMLRAKSFDVVLLDLVMPDMDGYQLLSQIKGDETLSHLPVIVISNTKEVASAVECIQLGATDYLTKPFDPVLLAARLNASLAQKRLRDIERAYALKLKVNNEMLNIRNQELDAFSSMVAHDLKTPLTTIIASVKLLLTHHKQMPANTLQQELTRIETTSERMGGIINALLLLATVSKQQVETQPLDMESIVKEVQERLANMIEAYQPKISLPTVWPTAIGYAPWIKEIWANYISNALKYGGTPASLNLGAEKLSNNFIRFWVRDNGQGISQDDQDKLFTPFTRLEQNRVEGQGLGLSIVKQIAEKLNGQVGLESTINQGSIFWFTLPSDSQGE